jgi:hypothetical protein
LIFLQFKNIYSLFKYFFAFKKNLKFLNNFSEFLFRCLDTAETCKFSHDHLSDITRNILLKHLEAAPKEILGDFPRLTREAAQALVFQTEAKNKGWLEAEGKTAEDVQKSVGTYRAQSRM